ncbi:MAG: chorismate-binding protein, partial [Chitinophagaceae bacterium]|nr:chorismate-binding protein [Chitinophagaceae bacterium]
MKKITIQTQAKRMLADVFTPVGIYLRIRDRFRDTILLESTDHHAAENSYSFICINAIAGAEIRTGETMECKLPAQQPEKINIQDKASVPDKLWTFMQRFDIQKPLEKEVQFAQGLFGYTCFDAVQFFDTVSLQKALKAEQMIPLMRYRLYQYVIVFNHYKDELLICENKIAGIESEIQVVESLIRSKDVPVYPFRSKGAEVSNLTDKAYKEMVQQGIQSCMRGDVFQIVLSRRFQQSFTGDEFNVYRALRSVNPSPYLFFFDYGEYKLMGSSPEAQLVIQNGKAIVHPIAGTFKRTGDDETDHRMAVQLLIDAKEKAEHGRLVVLARNDL